MTVYILWGTCLQSKKLERKKKKGRREYLVHVPDARGRVIPDIDSIKDDLPALWEPMTAIMGKSISAPTLDEK